MAGETRALTRDQFRERVLARDGNRCVLCGRGPAQGVKLDAHHILERRLWPDGGYHLDNGATVCDPDCHMKAEQTLVSCEELRARCGITRALLPPHLDGDETYDKWGNVVLEGGFRAPGELMADGSVNRILEPVLSLFTAHYKAPRTPHLPWSAGRGPGEFELTEKELEGWGGREVVVTLKLDGALASIYHGGYVHGRRVTTFEATEGDRIKSLAAEVGWDLPTGFRVVGASLSPTTRNLSPHPRGFFPVFSVWRAGECLPWSETLEWAELLGLTTPPVLYQGPWQPGVIRTLDWAGFEGGPMDGYVVRPAGSFSLREYRSQVGKFVRRPAPTPNRTR